MRASKTLAAILLVWIAWGPVQLAAWGTPDPVALDIPNIEQETNYWCWAALVQQLIAARKIGSPPKQCQLADALNELKGRPASYCCRDLGQPECEVMATHPEITSLIERYGGRSTVVETPDSPEEVYNYLAGGQAILCSVKITPEMNHIYLVRGLSWENGQAMLLINDPATGGPSKKVPFQEARPTWQLTLAAR